MNTMYQLYGGTGVIGSYFHGLYGGHLVPRESLEPEGSKVLYLISTTSNAVGTVDEHVFTNITSLMRRLIACRDNGVTEFNFVSSWFVYGKHDSPRQEESQCRPHGIYSITKYYAEQLVIDFCTLHSIKWRILRLGNVYGGPDKSDGTRNALHYIVQRLRDGDPVSIIAGVSRDYLHIGDICRAINLVCSQGNYNQIYNVACGNSCSLFDVTMLCHEFTQSKSVIHKSTASGEGQSAFMGLDCSRLTSLGFVPLLSLREGLYDLCTSQRFSIPAHFSLMMK